MRDRVAVPALEPAPPDLPGRLGAVRRLLEKRERRILELEASLADLWEKNRLLHDAGQSHIDNLERYNRELLAKKERLKEKVSSLRDELKSLEERSQWSRLARFFKSLNTLRQLTKRICYAPRFRSR
jgi:chromosome segregation ATPase